MEPADVHWPVGGGSTGAAETEALIISHKANAIILLGRVLGC